MKNIPPEISSYLFRHTGKSLEQLVDTLKENIKKYKYDRHIECGNVSIFYSDNPNYGMLGAGFFLKVKDKKTFFREFKISSETI